MKLIKLRLIAIVLLLMSLFAVTQAHALNVGDHLKIDSLTMIDGQQLSAAQLKGKYLVVQVWATWCPYCHRQNANLKELVRKTQGGNLEVIGLSIDKRIETVQKYAKNNDINFNLAMMTPELERMFGKRRGIPELYVIDPSGRVLQKDVGQMVDLDVFELARFNRR
ncbi:TlpA disulfide reductase family protein [Zwartia vadi]|uniref:TlpA disulfide reductase family protein n=1 Tax=Zwartia vadi TaxID=3058168 RepID=UPI0025B45E01|nr:TlpA disulfide reductase family protein [Zwartia vadi]MDN3987815.1 TlpA disulfide reductase family protein [Zwartia vadi]